MLVCRLTRQTCIWVRNQTGLEFIPWPADVCEIQNGKASHRCKDCKFGYPSGLNQKWHLDSYAFANIVYILSCGLKGLTRNRFDQRGRLSGVARWGLIWGAPTCWGALLAKRWLRIDGIPRKMVLIWALFKKGLSCGHWLTTRMYPKLYQDVIWSQYAESKRDFFTGSSSNKTIRDGCCPGLHTSDAYILEYMLWKILFH